MMTTPPAAGDGQSKADAAIRPASSMRTPRVPLIDRRVWVLGSPTDRLDVLVKALEGAGHAVRTAVTGAELAPTLREFRPHLIVIDMQEDPERGRHIAAQLRADRATRQVPIVLVGAKGVNLKSTEKPITGPSRRYTRPMDAPTVISAILTELL